MMVTESGPEAAPLGTRNPEPGTLVIQTAHLGDLVLTLPLLTLLAERHGPVDLVSTPLAAPLAEGHPAVRRTIPFDKHGTDAGLRGLLRVGRALRSTGYTRVVLPHGSLRSAALARLTGARERIGFAGAAGAIAYTRRIVRPAAGHESMRLAALAGAAVPPAPPWLHLAPGEHAAALEWLTVRGIDGPFIVFAPGSRWGTKRWPRYPELALALDHPIVVIGGPEDRALAESITEPASGRAWTAAGVLGLRASAALIARAALLVTNDSVALHLAAALVRPVVAIFGPTVPEFGFGPLGDEPVVQQTTLACRPCSAHGPATCPLGHHRCMQEIGVGRVAAAVQERLARVS